MWVKRSKLSSLQYFFSWGGDGINFDSSDRISIWNGSAYRYTTAVFRDTSSWYHLTISCNAGTITIYVNGVAHALSSSVSYPAWGNVYFGRWSGNTSYNFDGYLADIYGIEGSALDHTSFTESNNYGGYIPKAYTGSFGTNGFHIDAQPAHDADLLVTSVARNDGDTDFADAAKGHGLTVTGSVHHDDTVGNPFDSSGTAMRFDGSGDEIVAWVDGTSGDYDFGTADYTIECWAYIDSSNSAAGTYNTLWASALYKNQLFEYAGDVHYYTGSSGGSNPATDAVFPTSQWNHVAVVRDSGTMRLYVNGKFGFSYDQSGDAGGGLTIGGGISGYASYSMDGHIYDFRVTGGEAKYSGTSTASDWANFDEITAPFELNPVYLGGDQSGNKNHWEPTNISTTDIRTDVPTDSFCVMSPIDKGSGVTLSEGNLKAVCNNDWDNVRGTMGATSGKFYYEVVGNIAASTRWNAGVDINQKCQVDTYNNNTGSIVYSLYDGKIYDGAGGNSSATQDQSETNARIGVAVDIDAGKVWFRFNNGSWELSGGDPTSGSSSGSETFTAGSLVQPLFAGYGATFTVYFQESEWTDTAPTDYGEWKTSRLGTPVIKPAENFNTVLYTGTRDNSNSLGATSNPVSGMGFSPELLWIKDRDNQSTNNGSGYSGHWLFDSVQGSGKALNIDGGYYTGSNDFSGNGTGVSSFTSPTGGFTLGDSEAVNFAYDSDYNGSIDTYERYVAWGWKLGQSGSSSTWAAGNTDPTTEKYNSSAGVSVIRQEETSSSYPMTGVTVNHSLGAEPEFAFLIDVTSNTSDIFAWHKDLDANKYLKLNQNSVQTTGSGYFPSGCSTATTFQIGGDIAGANSMDGYWDIYLYLFSGVEGYSKFGKYKGNASADGPFIYTGFRPAFVLIKPSSTSGSWLLFDSARDSSNSMNNTLYPHNSNAESGSGEIIDFYSSGFKIRGNYTDINSNADTKIYAAFAETPFARANAR
jgi:hypothetical protein